MHAIVKRVKWVVKNHRYRSQLQRRVQVCFPNQLETWDLLMSLIDIVSETHDKGLRDDGDLLKSHEYGMFAIALVYCGIRDVPTLVAILLHDMYEDYPEVWSLYIIAEKYGQEVADIVFAVTKPDKAKYGSRAEHDEAIFARVRAGGIKAMVVKCIDRLHNMLTLYGSDKKRERKVYQTIEHVLSISTECKTLRLELMLATSEQLQLLKPAVIGTV